MDSTDEDLNSGGLYGDEPSAYARDDFLKRTAGLAAGVAALGLSGLKQVTPLAAAATPKRGGVVQIAIGLAAGQEGLDPLVTFNDNDAIYLGAIYDNLVEVEIDGLSPF